jgi:hypothetical protein
LVGLKAGGMDVSPNQGTRADATHEITKLYLPLTAK